MCHEAKIIKDGQWIDSFFYSIICILFFYYYYSEQQSELKESYKLLRDFYQWFRSILQILVFTMIIDKFEMNKEADSKRKATIRFVFILNIKILLITLFNQLFNILKLSVCLNVVSLLKNNGVF